MRQLGQGFEFKAKAQILATRPRFNIIALTLSSTKGSQSFPTMQTQPETMTSLISNMAHWSSRQMAATYDFSPAKNINYSYCLIKPALSFQSVKLKLVYVHNDNITPQ